MSLVAEQALPPSRIVVCDDVRRDVNDLGLYSGRLGEELMNRVPREAFVRGDLNRLSDRGWVPEEREECARKVVVMRQRPERRPVAVNDHRLALPHAMDHRPSAVGGQEG